MKNCNILKIADLYYIVSTSIRLTPNYIPFMEKQNVEHPVTSTVSIGKINDVHDKYLCHKGLIIDSNKELSIYVLNNKKGGYFASLKEIGKSQNYELLATTSWDCILLSDNCAKSECPSSIIDIFMMLIFIYSSAYCNTVLIHASCIKHGNDAIAFIGDSGVGKSTHSRLWLAHVENTELLNDDQPAVRIFEDDKVIIYGTPWSGKTSCYKQLSCRLRALIRMKQASVNEIIPLVPVLVFRELLSSCSMMKSDVISFKHVASTLSKIASCVKGGILKNKPEPEAVEVAYNFMTTKLIT